MRLPADAVLLVIDVQAAIDDPRGGRRNNPAAEAAIADLIAAWRAAELPIVHIHHDSPEPSSPYRAGEPGHAFKPEAAPLPGETVLVKSAASAFVGTGLDEMLTRQGCTTLVACGVPIQSSVAATVRHAVDLGYRAFVVADACAAVGTSDALGRQWPAQDVHALSLALLRDAGAIVVDRGTACAAALIARARQRG